jgi:hypothetical protein
MKVVDRWGCRSWWEQKPEPSSALLGLDIPQLLEAVLRLLPLDTYVESPVRTKG